MTSMVRGPQVAALALCVASAWWSHSSTSAPALKVSRPPSNVLAPGQLGLWVGKALPVDHRAVDVLETDQVALMEYWLGAEPPVWFAQVAGFGTRAAFHPPELCYVGSHYEVVERTPITVLVQGHPRRLMRLVISQKDRRYEAWYWFTANGRVTPSYYEQQLWLAADSIHHKPMSGTLVRISTVLDDPAAAHRRLLAFITAFEASPHPSNSPPSYGL